MNLQIARTKTDFENINQFFGKMWKEEFDLDRFDRVEDYKKGTTIFIEKNDDILSAIYFYEIDGNWKIGRFGVEKSHRGKGLGKKIFLKMEEKIQKKSVQKIQVFAQIDKVPMYEHFGFTKIGEAENIGNTQTVMMGKKYF